MTLKPTKQQTVNTTEEPVQQVNRLESILSAHAAPVRAAAPEPAPSGDFAQLLRGYADSKSASERLEAEYRAAVDQLAESRNHLMELAARITEPVAYVLQEQPGMAYVMSPPEPGERIGRMTITPLVMI